MKITDFGKIVFVTAALGLGSLAVSGCEEQGPAEKAGEKIDEAINDTKRAVEDATD